MALSAWRIGKIIIVPARAGESENLPMILAGHCPNIAHARTYACSTWRSQTKACFFLVASDRHTIVGVRKQHLPTIKFLTDKRREREKRSGTWSWNDGKYRIGSSHFQGDQWSFGPEASIDSEGRERDDVRKMRLFNVSVHSVLWCVQSGNY